MTETSQKKQAELIFKGLFSDVFGEIKAIFKRAYFAPTEDLVKANPTYTELSQALTCIYELMQELNEKYLKISAHDLEHLKSCIDLISYLGKAIDTDDHDGICEALATLAEKPYI